jgi:hypothetical protein
MYDPMINMEELRRQKFYEAMRPSWFSTFMIMAMLSGSVIMALVAVWG